MQYAPRYTAQQYNDSYLLSYYDHYMYEDAAYFEPVGAYAAYSEAYDYPAYTAPTELAEGAWGYREYYAAPQEAYLSTYEIAPEAPYQGLPIVQAETLASEAAAQLHQPELSCAEDPRKQTKAAAVGPAALKTGRRVRGALHKCTRCSRNYKRLSSLRSHEAIHSGYRPYVCPICSKNFAQQANLRAHQRTHTGERPYRCDLCPRRFSQSSSLVTHRRTHTGEKPYNCSTCRKAFADSSTLTKHLRTHTGEKPYRCQQCSQSFSQSGNLNRHKRIHQVRIQDPM